jgi:hypothetical protein
VLPGNLFPHLFIFILSFFPGLFFSWLFPTFSGRSRGEQVLTLHRCAAVLMAGRRAPT